MRGFVFILESVFAGLILVGFMLYLAQGYVSSGHVAEMDFSGVLPELDQAGLLRPHAYPPDPGGLESEIVIPGHSVSVRLCDSGGSCLGGVPSGGNIHVSSYFLAGEGSYQPLEVILYVREA